MAWGVPKLGTLVEDATGNFTLIEPAGVAEGDLMIACIAYRGNAAITLSGWTAVATAQNSGDTDATNGIASGAMFYIVRGADPPNLIATRTGGDVVLARVISYSNSTPGIIQFDEGSSNTLGSASATGTTGTLTTDVAGELIVAMASGGDAYTVSAFDAATNPANASGATDTTTVPSNNTWLERHDSNTGTGADATLAIADAVRSSAGATGTIQCTFSGSARQVMLAGAFKVNQPPTVVLNEPVNVNTYYFDGSDGGPTDPDSFWTGDANAFDGSTSTWAACGSADSTVGSTTSRYLLSQGTSAPPSSDEIIQVRARVYGSGDEQTGIATGHAAIYTDSLGELLGTANSNLGGGAPPNWDIYTVLSTPSGGWTWEKIQTLEVKVYADGWTLNGEYRIYRVEIEVTSIPTVTTATPQLEFTGTDTESNAIRYNVQVDTVDTFDSQVSTMDSYGSASDIDSDHSLDNSPTGDIKIAQSFTGDGGQITEASVWMKNSGGTVNENIVAKIEGHTGSYGLTSEPNGSVLSTSNNVAGSALTGSYQKITFTFPTPYTAVNGTNYTLVIEMSSIPSGGVAVVGIDTGGTHDGNEATFSASGGWAGFQANGDIPFEIISALPLLSKISNTDTGFADISTFADNFNDNSEDTTKWTSFHTGTSTIAETGGEVVATPPNTTAGSNYAGYTADNTYNLTGKAGIIKVPTMVNTATSAQCYLALILDGSNRLEILVEGTTIFFRKIVAGTPSNVATATYNASTHLWWRIRESGGTTFWDTSTDGITWTNRASQANPITVTALKPEFGAGTYQSEILPGTAHFDNFSIGSTDPFASASKVGYVVEPVDALSDGTYYWRVRATDPSGSNKYGAWSGTGSFAVDAVADEVGYGSFFALM